MSLYTCHFLWGVRQEQYCKCGVVLTDCGGTADYDKKKKTDENTAVLQCNLVVIGLQQYLLCLFIQICYITTLKQELHDVYQ